MIGTELGDLRRTHYSTELNSLNEGTEVIIKQNQKNWIEIILLDGKRAWLTSNKIRLLIFKSIR